MYATEVFKTNEINSNLTCLEIKALVRRKEHQDELAAWYAARSFSESMLTTHPEVGSSWSWCFIFLELIHQI